MNARVVCAGILLATASGHRSPADLVFVAAYADSAGVRFPVDSVDWAGLARRAFPDVDHPDTARLAANYFESGAASFLQFRAPVPARVGGRHYIGLTVGGLVALRPIALGGAVGYSTRPPDWTVGAPAFEGKLIARTPAGGIPDAMFVAVADRPIALTSVPVQSAVVVDSIELRIKTAFGLRDLHLQGWFDLRVLERLSVTVIAEGGVVRYLMVGGDMPEETCVDNFALYDIGTGARLIAERGGVCDP